MEKAVQEIVGAKHIAIVGVSDKKFGGTIYKTLKKNGYVVDTITAAKNKPTRWVGYRKHHGDIVAFMLRMY